MKPRRLALYISSLLMLSAVVVVILLARVGVSSAVSDADTPTIGGAAAPEVTFERLVENSDVVVLGEITSKQVSMEPCCERFAGRLSPSMPAPVRRVETLQVDVQESFRGNGSSNLTIKVQRPGGNIIRSGDDELSAPGVRCGTVVCVVPSRTRRALLDPRSDKGKMDRQRGHG